MTQIVVRALAADPDVEVRRQLAIDLCEHGGYGGRPSDDLVRIAVALTSDTDPRALVAVREALGRQEGFVWTREMDAAAAPRWARRCPDDGPVGVDGPDTRAAAVLTQRRFRRSVARASR